jgi:hypothetical protein
LPPPLGGGFDFAPPRLKPNKIKKIDSPALAKSAEAERIFFFFLTSAEALRVPAIRPPPKGGGNLKNSCDQK